MTSGREEVTARIVSRVMCPWPVPSLELCHKDGGPGGKPLPVFLSTPDVQSWMEKHVEARHAELIGSLRSHCSLHL